MKNKQGRKEQRRQNKLGLARESKHEFRLLLFPNRTPLPFFVSLLDRTFAPGFCRKEHFVYTYLLIEKWLIIFQTENTTSLQTLSFTIVRRHHFKIFAIQVSVSFLLKDAKNGVNRQYLSKLVMTAYRLGTTHVEQAFIYSV